MTERTVESVDGTLQCEAVERLLEWGFSREDITATIGHSEAWVREVQETQRPQDGQRSTTH